MLELERHIENMAISSLLTMLDVLIEQRKRYSGLTFCLCCFVGCLAQRNTVNRFFY